MPTIESKCWECGEIFESYVHEDDFTRRRWCDSCQRFLREEEKRQSEIQRKIRKIKAMETALGILERQGYDMYGCKNEIEAVKDAYFSDRSKYGSSLEIAVAVELLINRIKVKTQVKIRSYRADMVLPDLKIVLEIDGVIHSKGNQKDAMRDILVHEAMGPEWETVRIRSDRINAGLNKLLPYILDQHSKQQELREKYNGDIPWTYNHNEFTEIYRLGKKLKSLKTN